VHIAARVAASAQPDEVLVSSTVKDLVAGSGLRFDAAASMPSKACRANGACSLSNNGHRDYGSWSGSDECRKKMAIAMRSSYSASPELVSPRK